MRYLFMSVLYKIISTCLDQSPFKSLTMSEWERQLRLLEQTKKDVHQLKREVSVQRIKVGYVVFRRCINLNPIPTNGGRFCPPYTVVVYLRKS